MAYIWQKEKYPLHLVQNPKYMNEIDKMRKSELADMEKPEIQASFIHAKKLLAKMRTMTIYDEDFRQILEELVPNIPITSIICPPFIVTMAPVSNWENMYLSILIVLFWMEDI